MPVADEAAIALPETPEPLVIDRAEVSVPQTPPLSRQARRKALRAEAKALKRAGYPPAPGTRAARPAAAVRAADAEPAPAPDVVEPVKIPEPVAEVATLAEAEPLLSIATAPKPAPAAVSVPPTAAKSTSERGVPLPRSRALVAGKPRGIALFVHKLRVLFSVKQAYVAPVAETPIASQLRSLRADLATLQRSLDRMIEGVTA